MQRTHRLISFFLSSALFTLLAYPLPAHATTASAAAEKRETIKSANEEFRTQKTDAIKDLRTTKASGAAQLKETMEDARTVRKATISGARQLYRSERAANHGERIERRFTFYAQRLTNIATRIQKRIDTEKAAGKDVSAAQTALDKAKTLLAQAVVDSKQAVTMFQSISVATWDTQSPEIKAAIEQANKARAGFVQTRLSLIDATAALK